MDQSITQVPDSQRAQLEQPQIAPKPRKEDIPETTPWQLSWMMLTSFLPLALLILAVLGSILFGLATPTEAAAVGALGGILLAFGYRAMTWGRLRESVYLTVRTTAMVCGWHSASTKNTPDIGPRIGKRNSLADSKKPRPPTTRPSSSGLTS